MFTVACPNCQKRLKLSKEQLKRKLRCSGCPTRFVVAGQKGKGADGNIECLAVEVFEEEVAEGFEIVEPKPAPAASAAGASESPEGPVYSDNVLPDEFGLIDDEPSRHSGIVVDETPMPKARPVPVKAKPAPAQRPAPAPIPKAKPITVPPPAPKPAIKKPAAVAADAFDLGDEDTREIDIHLEMRTPEEPPPPRVAPPPAPPPPPIRTRPPARPVARKAPAPPVIDDVEVIEEEFEITAPAAPPSVRTTKSGIPIVEAASDDEIAEYEARQAARRKQLPPRRR
jgi:hypothetical protein